jgi:RimJ/RimL family protein N-acetyltransferase
MKQICKNQDVSIRELDSDDLASLAEYANNPKVAINLRDAFPNPYTLEDAANFLKMAESMNQNVFFAI